VDIYVLKSHVSSVTWALARLRVVHLVDVHGSMGEGALGLEKLQHEEAERRWVSTIERAKRLMELVGLRYQPLSIEGTSERNFETLEKQLDDFEKTLPQLIDRARSLEQTASSAIRATGLLQLIVDSKCNPAALARSGRLAVRIGLLPPEQVSSVKERMSAVPHFFQQLGEIETSRAAVVASLAADRTAVEETLRQAHFEEFALPELPIAAAAESASKREAEISAELRAVRETLRRASLQAERPLSEIRRGAEIALGLSRARGHFSATGHTMIISGWVPRDRLDEVRRLVEERAPDGAYVEVVSPSDLRQMRARFAAIPVLFNNPLFLKPFQRMTAAYGTPQYGEVEPTAFVAVSFLIMFGVMFGDLGQGLVLSLLGYLLFRASYRYTDVGVLLIECGAAAAVFGILYGSVFGAENLIPALWFNPMRNLTTSIAVSLGFGAVLISIGLLLNIVNSFRSRETSAAIFGERGLVGAFTYWVCLAIGTKFVLSGEVGLTAAALTLLIGVPALTILFRRPIEAILQRRSAKRPAWRDVPFFFVESLVDLGDAFLSYLANTVSFIRLSAFSLAHIGLFAAVFALAESLSAVRGGGAWYWITLFVGNVVIILLEGLIASIQAIRLEYYELFSKFFKGGGEEFHPLEV
jgi:V/A-type H+-transporting ATPase subunit I